MLQLRYVRFLKEHSYELKLMVVLLLFSFIESQCGSFRVKLKNNAATIQGTRQGTFQLSSPVNGRPSWTSESQAIWYVPIYKEWAIGHLDDIGGTIRGITSDRYNEVDDRVDDPRVILSWQYWNGDEFVPPDEKNDIIVECIEGKWKMIFLFLFVKYIKIINFQICPAVQKNAGVQ